MEVSLAGRLEALGRGDLAALLCRRPEVRPLLGAKRCDLTALAGAISRPEAVLAAVDSLDGFLLNLLHAAILLGPESSALTLAPLAPGVDPQELAAGAEELSRWGLAFVACNDPSGRVDGSGNWGLHVPACVSGVVPPPVGRGPWLAQAFANRSPAFLAGIATNLGLPSGAEPGGPGSLAGLSAILRDPARVAALLAEAPSGSRAIVAAVREVGGFISWDELVRRGLVSWGQGHWGGQGPASLPLAWLESRGVLVAPSVTIYAGGPVAVPAEVEVALRGGRLFESWPPAKPPALARAAGATAATNGQPAAGDPGASIADLHALLDLWAQAPSPALQKGGLGARELRRAAKALGLPEDYVAFLYALAVESRLLAQDDSRRVVPTPAAAAWAARPPAKRWAALFETYLAGRLWVETKGGLVDVDKVEPRAYLLRLRRSLVSELAALPAEATTDIQALGQRLMWRHPSLIHCEDCAVTVSGQMVKALGWLGILSPPPTICLLEPARSALADPGWTEQASPATAAFAPPVSEITVGADLSIIVAGPPLPALGAALARFADLQVSSPARIYRLSEASVRRALDAGMKGSQITAVLKEHAPRGLPQNVAYLIDDVANRHGHLVIGHAGLYLRSDDAALLAAAIADRKLAAFGPRLLAPTVALLDGGDPAKALSALRSAGYLPVVEAGGASLAAPKAPVVSPILPPARGGSTAVSPADLARIEAEVLAEALLKGSATAAPRRLAAAARKGEAPAAPGPGVGLPRPAPPSAAGDSRQGPAGHEPGEPPCTNPDGIRRLLELAAEEDMVVEIGYVTAKGRSSLRTVEPYSVLATRLYATCHHTGAELAIPLARIVSARATGDPLADEEDEDEDLSPLLVPLP